jgi:sugar phosphate permease
MVIYALNLWGPTYLIRTFGYTRPEAGWTFGVVMIVAGTAGLLLAGTLADAWMKRGTIDAYVRTILLSIVGLLPCALVLGFATSDVVSISAIALAVFQLFANLVGLALGPTVVAMTTDYVFGYDEAIGKSIALSAAILCPLGGIILWRSLASIRSELEAQSAIDGQTQH